MYEQKKQSNHRTSKQKMRSGTLLQRTAPARSAVELFRQQNVFPFIYFSVDVS